jgi:hypothetical protein
MTALIFSPLKGLLLSCSNMWSWGAWLEIIMGWYASLAPGCWWVALDGLAEFSELVLLLEKVSFT